MLNRTKQESVSIIVPVFNGENELPHCLSALMSQDYPAEKIQIILADNGSTDKTLEIARYFNRVELVEEREVQSSYAARNKALKFATGEIIGFTDSDCIPGSGWISSAVECLNRGKSEVIGGKVEFKFSRRRNSFELYDSLYHMNQKETTKRGMIATANLFTSRRVLEEVGEFDSELISGGDAQWSARAIKKGFKLGYCPDAVVEHPTRTTRKSNYKKENRIGMGEGQLRMMRSGGQNRFWECIKVILGTFPGIVRHVWPAVKFTLKGRVPLVQIIPLIGVAKYLYLAKRIGTLSYIINYSEGIRP